ncbi:MAG: TlpA disulfide reductase family protein [Hyphomicrobiaceae bacterium]
MINLEAPPEFTVAGWLNADEAPTLNGLKGKVVVVLAFQMLCPGCVSQALPQLQRLRERFGEEDVAVLGLHTVFEHHEVMTPKALEAFVHEYRFSFPIGIDRPQDAGLPETMLAYEMRGTPTLLIFDREGRLRRHYFGRPDDLVLGAEIAAMVLETDARQTERVLSRALLMPGHRHSDDDHSHQHGDGCGCGHPH